MTNMEANGVNVSRASAPVESGALDALCAAIERRRSMGVARLLPDPVPAELIERALRMADWAPSHGETEPWRFTVYTGAARAGLGEAFAQAYRKEAEEEGVGFKQATFDAQRERTQASPVWISIGMQPAQTPDGALKMDTEEELIAMGAAVQNLHLTANAEGLAGMWLSNSVFRHASVAEFAGLMPPHGRLLGFFVLGWPATEWLEGERRPLSEKVRWAEGSDR